MAMWKKLKLEKNILELKFPGMYNSKRDMEGMA